MLGNFFLNSVKLRYCLQSARQGMLGAYPKENQFFRLIVTTLTLDAATAVRAAAAAGRHEKSGSRAMCVQVAGR
jgi:hypothetical protein